jgi:hypothetical protein
VSNRRLTDSELASANLLLDGVRQNISDLAGNDRELAWALRRKISKELSYDERGKPMQRKLLKVRLRGKQGDRCASCGSDLPTRGAVLDRLEAMGGYTEANTRLLCPDCDGRIQEERGYA